MHIACYVIRVTAYYAKLEMWAISDALPLEAARTPNHSACQFSAQSSDARLSYCDFTDSPQRGPNSTTDLGEGW